MDREEFERLRKKQLENKIRSFNKHLNKEKSKPYYLERDALNTIRFANRSGSHVNCFRYFKNNTKAHERKKFEKYMELIDKGHKVLVEAIFNNGKRCDILDLTDNLCIEIVNTESEESIVNKEGSYPFPIEVIKV